MFNNGGRRPDGTYSSVDELVLPINSDGAYSLEATGTYRPDRAAWSYTAPNKSDFFSMLISGAQRLPNGNTLICSGISGSIFEVTPDPQVVWKYVNPVKGESTMLSTEQKARSVELQKQLDDKLAELLTADQRQQLKQMQDRLARNPFGGFGGGPPGGPGDFLGLGPQPPGSSLFRSNRYGRDFPGLVGKDLTPGKTLEELESQKDEKKGTERKSAPN